MDITSVLSSKEKEMKVKSFVFNPVQENTYVLYDDTKECVIVDAGCYFEEEQQALLSFIKDNHLQVKHIINTHLHFDHVFGINFVQKQFDLPLHAHKDDEFLLTNFKTQLQSFGFPDTGEPAPQIGKYIDESDIIEFGDQTLKLFHVPGHSPGSIVFYNESAKCIFAGDVLFRQSIGRTDLVGGNYEQLVNGIKTKLLVLPDDTLVYSGHGPTTSIGYEKSNNAYLI